MIKFIKNTWGWLIVVLVSITLMPLAIIAVIDSDHQKSLCYDKNMNPVLLNDSYKCVELRYLVNP